MPSPTPLTPWPTELAGSDYAELQLESAGPTARGQGVKGLNLRAMSCSA